MRTLSRSTSTRPRSLPACRMSADGLTRLARSTKGCPLKLRGPKAGMPAAPRCLMGSHEQGEAMTEQEMNEAITSMAYTLNVNDDFLRQVIKSHGLVICSAEPVAKIDKLGFPKQETRDAGPTPFAGRTTRREE